MKRTKIICTMGPNTNDKELLKQLALEGMDVARFNFSHGDYEEHLSRYKLLKEVREETGIEVASLLDTKGPEIRTGKLKDGLKVNLETGKEYTLTITECIGDERKGFVNYAGLIDDVKVGSRILIDDGIIELEVTKIEGDNIHCIIINGGELGEKKGVNVPGVEVRLPALTDKDKEDIKFACEKGFDFIAASFVRDADCIHQIKDIIKEYAAHTMVIAKIESQQAVKNIDEIIEASDAIMVARGDLGVEIPTEEVPFVQKTIIKKCNIACKPVITATQMLDSMIRNPRPTRAETTDVANAIYDGTDAIMLSGETASGDYPVEAVQTMDRIARRIESSLHYKKLFVGKGLEHHTTTEAIAHATVQLAYELDAAAIITPTESGYTTQMVSKYRPKAAIFAFTPHEQVARHLNLRWGVLPAPAARLWKDASEMRHMATAAAEKCGAIKPGDVTIITSGIKCVPGNTSSIRVYTV